MALDHSILINLFSNCLGLSFREDEKGVNFCPIT